MLPPQFLHGLGHGQPGVDDAAQEAELVPGHGLGDDELVGEGLALAEVDQVVADDLHLYSLRTVDSIV